MTVTPSTIEQQEEEEKKIKEVRYRAYHTSPDYNSRLGQYSFVDLFELEAFHIRLSLDKIKFYLEDNPEQPIVTTAGEDHHIIRLSREQIYYHAIRQNINVSSMNKDYVIAPTLLRVRRFLKVSDDDLQQWEQNR